MATTPAWPDLTEGQWNLVANNVVTGIIKRLKSNYSYWVTYVATGVSAPADAIKLKSPLIFIDGNSEQISFQSAVDIYIWIENADTSTDDTVSNAIEVNI